MNSYYLSLLHVPTVCPYCLSVLTVYYTLHYSCYYQVVMNTGYDLLATVGVTARTLWGFLRKTHFP